MLPTRFPIRDAHLHGAHESHKGPMSCPQCGGRDGQVLLSVTIVGTGGLVQTTEFDSELWDVRPPRAGRTPGVLTRTGCQWCWAVAEHRLEAQEGKSWDRTGLPSLIETVAIAELMDEEG